MNNNIKVNLSSHSSKIGIIGLGYVGLPVVLRFAEEGFTSIGFDIDIEKVNSLNKGESYIKYISDGQIANARKNKFLATSDFSKVHDLDVIIICVPTPLDTKKNPDLGYIKKTINQIIPYIKINQILVLESTTYPGTTEELIYPLIKNCGFDIGKNFFIGYSPERVDPSNKEYNIKTIPKVVSGYTNNCLELIKTLYQQIVDKIVPVSSVRIAEMTKMLENIQRAVNIALVNELKMVADKMNIDIHEVIKASKTKPFGFMPYYPGPGLGGHCIPIDPYYLSWKANKLGINTRFIELAGEVNAYMPKYVIKKIVIALKTINKSIKGSKILILGLAYKKNTDDTRESPALFLIDLLLKSGALIEYSDPFIPNSSKTRKYNFELKSIVITKKTIKSFDLVLLATDHDAFDYDFIENEANLIVDTRGKFNKIDKVIKA